MPLAVVKAVQSAIPAHIAFGARINGTDWHADGLTPDDAVAQAALLKAAGLHFICVSSGGASPDAKVAALLQKGACVSCHGDNFSTAFGNRFAGFVQAGVFSGAHQQTAGEFATAYFPGVVVFLDRGVHGVLLLIV